MKKKHLPVRVDDFKKIIEDNYYFVDKSLLIDELLSSKGQITLILRPRRFGKTLNMSMLRYFFYIEMLKKIEKTEFMGQQGKYPVIYMSFKDIKERTWNECLKTFKNNIMDTFLERQKYIILDLLSILRIKII